MRLVCEMPRKQCIMLVLLPAPPSSSERPGAANRHLRLFVGGAGERDHRARGPGATPGRAPVAPLQPHGLSGAEGAHEEAAYESFLPPVRELARVQIDGW